jgi:hypothetical protein
MNNLSILPNDNITDDPPPPPPVRGLPPPPIYTNVKVLDFEMSFSKMVTFMVKVSFAAIPAAIIIFMIWMVGLALLRAIPS